MIESDHKHCPFGHEHPQPTTLKDGREICQKCLIDDNEIVEMVFCSPEVCGGNYDASI